MNHMLHIRAVTQIRLDIEGNKRWRMLIGNETRA
jgi:hypothetical protein